MAGILRGTTRSSSVSRARKSYKSSPKPSVARLRAKSASELTAALLPPQISAHLASLNKSDVQGRPVESSRSLLERDYTLGTYGCWRLKAREVLSSDRNLLEGWTRHVRSPMLLKLNKVELVLILLHSALSRYMTCFLFRLARSWRSKRKRSRAP